MTNSGGSLEQNKAIVRRFNREAIELGNEQVLAELVADAFVNHAPIPGVPAGREGLRVGYQNLRRAFGNLSVEIFEQIAERDLVTTRKVIRGTHVGSFVNIAPTGRAVAIHVIDIVRLSEGRYVEHWASSNLEAVVRGLRG